jgi:hypothetical protein
MNRRAGLLIVLIAASASLAGSTRQSEVPRRRPDTWYSFGATWSATGTRHELPTEDDRRAAVIRLSGSIALTDGQGLARGFLGELIGFDDGRATSVGRAVWTDGAGDRIFAEVSGERLQQGRRVAGVFTGGSGRYAGLSGDFAFTWQYLTMAEGGQVQGMASGFVGRFRFAERSR